MRDDGDQSTLHAPRHGHSTLGLLSKGNRPGHSMIDGHAHCGMHEPASRTCDLYGSTQISGSHCN